MAPRGGGDMMEAMKSNHYPSTGGFTREKIKYSAKAKEVMLLIEKHMNYNFN